MRDEIVNLGYLEGLDPIELIAFPSFLIVILVWSNYISSRKKKLHPEYKYYTLGLAAKMFGAIAFCWVYTYYYKGGDTISYFESARAFVNLLLDDPSKFSTVYFSAPSQENLYLFSGKTGYPWGYMYFDKKTFWVIRIVTPFVFLGVKSYLLSTMWMALFAYSGVWKLFQLFVRYYPQMQKLFFFSVLLLPSAVFWGSGMLKDTITLSGTCWFIFSFHDFFILKKDRVINGIVLVVSFIVIFSIKPYIIIALLPGAIIWNFYSKILLIKNKFLRYSAIPFSMTLAVLLGYLFLSSVVGFSFDTLLEEAVIKQTDLKREAYQGNSFDIGTYDATFLGALGVSGPALIAGLFRPFIWDTKNVVMLLSGLENSLILVMLIIVFWRKRIFGVFRYILDHPLVLFCITYSLIFSLIIGLSTSNFGALVRFKIAFLPMFVSAIMVMYYYSGNRKYLKS
ncbi:MAG: hypothetical protein ACK40M_07890 [Flavobacteriales bacterium]